MPRRRTTDTSGPNVEDRENHSSPFFWKSQLNAAKRSTQRLWDSADEAYKEYLNSYQDEPILQNPTKLPETRFPIFWSSVRTIQPALYSRTPTLVAKSKLDVKSDRVAALACRCEEQLGKYLISTTPFDRTIYSARDDFILAGKTTNRVYFEAEIGKVPEKVYVFEQPQLDEQGQQAFDDNGQPIYYYIDTDQREVEIVGDLLEDEYGLYYEKPAEEILNQKTCLISTPYRDLLHTPWARTQDEVTWMAYKLTLTRRDTTQRFGAKVASELAYADKAPGKKKGDASQELPIGFCIIWEIWDQEDKKVRWLADTGFDEFLDEKDDPYKLPGFFPSPAFLLGTVGCTSLYPTPDFMQLRPFIYQLHALARRLKILIRATRKRGLVDGSVVELNNLMTEADEAEFITVNNFRQLMDKGGLASIIQFFPNSEISELLNQMLAVVNQYQAFFSEMYGIPDLMRGVSDPRETAAAQQQKGQYLSLRFSAIQREFQRFVRDDIEMMCDVTLQNFTVERLQEIMGYPQMSPEEQNIFPQALALLRDFDTRAVRIEIQTDSTIQMNEDLDVAQRNELAQTVLGSFTKLVEVGGTNPAAMKVGMEVIMHVIRGLRDGNMIEGDLEDAFEQMLVPPEPPPQPPDYTMLQLQLQKQLGEMKAQVDMAKLQNDSMKAQRDSAIEVQRLTSDNQIEQLKLQLDSQAQMFKQQIDSALLQIEQFKAQMIAVDKQTDNQRLTMEAMRPVAEPKQNQPAVSINVNPSKEAVPFPVPVPQPQPVAVPVNPLSGLPLGL